MAKFIRVTCPSALCGKEIFLDPSEVPPEGKSIICSACGVSFKVKLSRKDSPKEGIRGTDTPGLVVVIEDSRFARTQIVDALTQEGIEIVEAETAEEGIEKVIELKPKLVIVDIFLGSGNPKGLDVIRTIKKRTVAGIPANIKIIMYTVMSEEKVPLTIRKMADAFIHKGPTALFHLVEEVLRLLGEESP
jgi:CheY-like chemotaxis protein